MLFEATPEETRKVAERCRTEGYSVVKFGWGPLGLDSLETDVALVAAARDGLGPDISLCVDAGTIYKRDAAAALLRANAFAAYDILFLEEPVLQEAISAYSEVVEESPVRIAGGEGSDTVRMAEVRTLGTNCRSNAYCQRFQFTRACPLSARATT